MKYPLIFVFGFLFFNNIDAQVGILGGYHSFKNDDWNDAISFAHDAEFTTINGYSIGIDYWFRLKKRRIEFTPTVAYGKFAEDNIDFSREHQFISFHFNTNVYIFDLAADCDCPTWSKEGNILKKGFFVQLSPGISNMTNKHSIGSSDKVEYEATENYFELGIGVGLDIGISDFLTITPIAKLFISKDADWTNSLNPTPIDGEVKGNYRQVFLGMRLGLRFDEISRF